MVCPDVLTYCLKPASLAAPAEPRRGSPTGCAPAPQFTPRVPLLPTTPFQPINPGPGLINLPEAESGLAPQWTARGWGSGNKGGFFAEMPVFTCLDCSAKLSARTDVPHEPLIVRSSIA